MKTIGQKYNIAGNTLQYIASGKRHSELTQKFKVPLRKNLAENQTIFYNLYPQFVEKGDD